MTLLLVATHVAAFALGALVCNRVVLWYGRSLDIHISEDTMVEADQPRRSLPLIVVVLIASLFVIVIAGQAYFSRKASDQEQGCTNRWASDFTGYYQGRLQVSSAVREATVARDEATVAWQQAVGGIFTLFIVALSPDKPPQEQLEAQFSDALNAFSSASDTLEETRQSLAEATAAAGVPDPPPVLDLDCDNPLETSP